MMGEERIYSIHTHFALDQSGQDYPWIVTFTQLVVTEASWESSWVSFQKVGFLGILIVWFTRVTDASMFSFSIHCLACEFQFQIFRGPCCLPYSLTLSCELTGSYISRAKKSVRERAIPILTFHREWWE